MDTRETLTEVEGLLLMAAAVHGMGPASDLSRANTERVVNQVLRWRGLSAEEIRDGWMEQGCGPIHEEIYSALIRMTCETARAGLGRPSARPGAPLFEGGGNWGVPADPNCPACMPQFNSCRLTAEGERLAQDLLAWHPEYRMDAEAGAAPDFPSS
jgi:hypothetical protein